MAIMTKTLLNCIGRLAGRPVTRTGTGTLDSTVTVMIPKFSGGPTRTPRAVRLRNIACGVCGTAGKKRFVNTTMRSSTGNFNNTLGMLMNFSGRNGVVSCSLLDRTRAPKLKSGTTS